MRTLKPIVFNCKSLAAFPAVSRSLQLFNLNHTTIQLCATHSSFKAKPQSLWHDQSERTDA